MITWTLVRGINWLSRGCLLCLMSSCSNILQEVCWVWIEQDEVLRFISVPGGIRYFLTLWVSSVETLSSFSKDRKSRKKMKDSFFTILENFTARIVEYQVGMTYAISSNLSRKPNNKCSLRLSSKADMNRNPVFKCHLQKSHRGHFVNAKDVPWNSKINGLHNTRLIGSYSNKQSKAYHLRL